jgi:hypothetical protein
MNLPPEQAGSGEASGPGITLLRDFASPPGVALMQRLKRRYRRLCFVQEELGRLNSLKAPAGNNSLKGKTSGGISFEDFVFSNMDFSRYKKIPEEDFSFYLEGIEDFDIGFFMKNFRINPAGAEEAISGAYKKIGPFYCLLKKNPLILSLMRTLETSLESVPLIQEEEILNELNALYTHLNAKKSPQAETSRGIFTFENIGPFFSFLLNRLDGLRILHSDGNETKLFVNNEGKLSGTFMPGNKPWTLSL